MDHREQRLRKLLKDRFPDAEISLENESSSHAVPPGSETHFKLLIISAEFASHSRIERSRMVQNLLQAEFGSGLHALSIRAITPDEANRGAGEGFVSPHCLGRRA
jgi:stress-induced morphogen